MKLLESALLVLVFAVCGMSMPSPDTALTQGDFRVLVVLVEFSDVKFRSNDPKSQFNDYLNKAGYNDYYNVGSVRDYFIKNSMGKFRPAFDVYGPVTLSETRDFYVGYDDSYNSINAGLVLKQSLDSLVSRGHSFSQYDSNEDNVVDYIVMIYAGISSSITGIYTFHPFAGYLGDTRNKQSGKKIEENLYVNEFACTNEVGERTYEKDNYTGILNGIGVFVHEFSHLLGLPDLYLQFNLVNKWSVMKNGCYNCPTNADYVTACAPPLYSAFERVSLRWLVPTEIKSEGHVQLNKLDDNVAYSITNPTNPNEMYLLEYRTNLGWDSGQDTSGLLIWYVNYVESGWNAIARNNVRVIEGDKNAIKIKVDGYEEGFSSPYDPLPGRGNVREFNRFVFSDGTNMNITLSDITESPDKDFVTFKVTMGTPFKTELSSSSGTSFALNISSSSAWSSTPPYSLVYLKSASSDALTQTVKHHASVVSQNGMITVNTPLLGQKTIRIFSLNGQVLFEKSMNGFEYQFQWPKSLGHQRVILSVTQKNSELYMGMISYQR